MGEGAAVGAEEVGEFFTIEGDGDGGSALNWEGFEVCQQLPSQCFLA